MPNTFKHLALFSLCFALQFVGFSSNQLFAEETDTEAKETSSEATSKKDEREGMSGIIYGKDHAYNVTAPKGWVLDNQAGVEQRLHAVFYPVGQSWSDGKAVMYSRITAKNGRTFEQVISDDLKHQSQDAPDFKIEDKPQIECKKGAKATIKFLTGDKYDSYEAIAYIEETNNVIIVVLTSRDKASFAPAVEPFNDLVKSYFWMTDKVEIHD